MVRSCILLFLIFYGLYGCLESTGPGLSPEVELIYWSTFELPTDTMGWEGCGEIKLSYDTSSPNGNHYLFVGGASNCITPGYKILETLPDTGAIIFRCQGKSSNATYGIVFFLSNLPDGTPWYFFEYHLPDTGWVAYSDTTGQLPKGSRLAITTHGDGIYIDNIEVLRIRNESPKW